MLRYCLKQTISYFLLWEMTMIRFISHLTQHKEYCLMTLSKAINNDNSHSELDINHFQIFKKYFNHYGLKFHSPSNNYLTLNIMAPYTVTLHLHSTSLRSTSNFHNLLILPKELLERWSREIQKTFSTLKSSFHS